MNDDKDKSLDKLRKPEDICKRINQAWNFWQNYAKDKLDRYSTIIDDYYSYRKQPSDPTKSCTFIPRTFEIVDIVRSRFMETLTSSDYYGRAIKRTGTGSGQPLTALMQCHLDKDEFYIKTSDNVLDILLFGQLFYKIPWERRYRLIPKIEPIYLPDPMTGEPTLDVVGRPVVLGDRVALDDKGKIVAIRKKIFDQPTVISVSPFDFFASMDEPTIEKCEFAGSRFWADLDEMREKGVYDEKVLDKIESDGIKPQSTKYESDERQREREAVRLGYPEGTHKKYEWLEVCTKDKIFVTLKGNNNYLVRNDDNVYMENIYKCAYIKPAPNEFLKLGMVESFMKIQHTINALTDDMMDIVNLMTNLMFIINEDASDENDYVSRQGNIFRVRGNAAIDNAIKIVQLNVNLTPIMELLRMLNSVLDTATGVVDVMKATSPPGTNTATEISGLMSQMAVRVKDMLCMLEYTYLKPIFGTFLKLYRVFMNEEEAVMIVKDGKILDDLIVKPGDISGDEEFEFQGITRESFRSVQVQQAIQALQTSGQIPPNPNPVQKLLMKLILCGLVPRMEREINEAIEQMGQVIPPVMGAGTQGGGASPVPVPQVASPQEQVTQTAQQQSPKVVTQ